VESKLNCAVIDGRFAHFLFVLALVDDSDLDLLVVDLLVAIGTIGAIWICRNCWKRH
jgi:hypothetical protein